MIKGDIDTFVDQINTDFVTSGLSITFFNYKNGLSQLGVSKDDQHGENHMWPREAQARIWGAWSILRPLIKRIQTACNKDFVFVPNSPLMAPFPY